ncbi:transposase [Thiocapsa rosea]|uniref:DDE family transposase n=1 Tax=Thiocapsa rosea TaxID=69360 RepID=A0A495VDE4_9GAMM|nr:transposase [Thiocapsa rosea]RKT47416.1 DDE family transposase [Thiocapsa rosea]
MFGEILQKFVEKSPTTVMVRVLLERLLNPEKLDRWFEATRQTQYTRNILFSSLVGLMLQVVCRTQASVHAAYRQANIAASIVAVYAKLQGVELTTSQALVGEIALEARDMILAMNGARPSLLPGYRLKYLDGNCLAASEHRLKPLRATTAGPLPGKSLVVFDPQLDIAVTVVLCADGHTQERALLDAVIPTVEANDVWLADRNFCVSQFLFEIHRKQAFFIIRQHSNLVAKPLEKFRFIGASASGDVYDQAVQLTSTSGETRALRRITVNLKTPTRNGDTKLVLLTNLPSAVADAPTIAALYRMRWGIETAFQKLEKHLHSEIAALGYPQAALFGFCLALVAFNLYAVVMAALRAAHPTRDIDQTVSQFYLAGEIATTMTGLTIAVPEHEWAPFVHATTEQLTECLLRLAQFVDLHKLRKSPRGPKKPPIPRTKYKGHTHVSTARLLAGIEPNTK